MAYTFDKANNYAKKHGILYSITHVSNMYLPELEYQVTVCDAFDGYCSSESYNIYYDKYYGYRYERRHFRYSFKKDLDLLSRICSALNDDKFNVIYDCWVGCEHE